MNKKISGTPFSEYREEQVRVNVFDYFVTPSFFDQFYDTKPLLIYGSRGSGKTTLFKALALSDAKNVESYLSDNSYIGIYYRIDLNIMASFCGCGVSDDQWSKLFAHYFISANKTCRQPAAIVRHRSPGTVSKAGDYERGWSVMIRRLEIFHGAEVSPA